MGGRFSGVLFLLFLFAAGEAYSQVSIGVTAGISQNQGPLNGDPYSLTRLWPTLGGDAIAFCTAGSGPAFGANLMWEASKVIGVGVVYSSANLNSADHHRTMRTSSLGLQLKVNFVRNTKKVVPFLQAAYMFTNSNKMHQDKATSTIYGSQTQPSFEITSSTGYGGSADLGVEIRLSEPWALLVLAGIHEVQLESPSANNAVNALNYGSYIAPVSVDGVVWLQGSAGLKYYFSRNSKKRDF